MVLGFGIILAYLHLDIFLFLLFYLRNLTHSSEYRDKRRMTLSQKRHTGGSCQNEGGQPKTHVQEKAALGDSYFH